MDNDAKACPWCQQYWLKDTACNHVCCGVQSGTSVFNKVLGCGRQWCFKCNKKLCGQLYDPATGRRVSGVPDNHPMTCPGCLALGDEACPGGHNSHRG